DWAVSSVVEHCLHTAGVTGSNPVPPTIEIPIKSISYAIFENCGGVAVRNKYAKHLWTFMVIGSLLGVDFEHKEFVSGEAGTSAIAQRTFPERFCRHRSSDRAVNLCFNYLHVSSGIFFISYEKVETTRRCVGIPV